MSENASGADNQQERLLMQKLTPDYILGLIDGEGYFSVIIDVRQYENYKTREVKLVFGISLKESDGEEMLALLKEYFNCGTMRLRIDKRPRFSNQWEYQVRRQEDIFNVIVPFFEQYKLKFKSKRTDFQIFSQITELVKQKKHLTEKGFRQILKLRKSMH